MKVREVEFLLERAGWRCVRRSRRGWFYVGPEGRMTVLAGNSGDDVPPDTLAALERETGLALKFRKKRT